MIQRDYLNQLLRSRKNGLVKIITGLRRVGKSTLLLQFSEKLKEMGISTDRIFYANLESLQNESLLNYQALYQEITSRTSAAEGENIILLDEIQKVPDWERVISSLMVDIPSDIYLTGSNASLFSAELATLMAGRYQEIHVYPLNFQEYQSFHQKYYQDNQTREEIFWEHLRYGGLPGLFRVENSESFKQSFLSDILTSVVLQDVVARANIRNVELLQRLLHFLAVNIGNITTASSIVKFLKSQGRQVSIETIYTYMQALMDGLIIRKVQRYDVQGKRTLETFEKYYFNDLGLIFALAGFNDRLIPGLLENFVFLELQSRGNELFIGKIGNAEVDFIAKNHDGIHYYQVSYLMHLSETVERERTSLLHIQDNYPKIILSLDTIPDSSTDGIERKNLIRYFG